MGIAVEHGRPKLSAIIERNQILRSNERRGKTKFISDLSGGVS